jgi:DNA-binding response OmpR family regulator
VAAPQRGRAGRVLVVDDEPNIRTVLRGYLEADGFAVSEASDGEGALAAVESSPVDVVLLDVMLPGIDGLEVLRRIRALGDTFVVVVSARTEEVDRLLGLGLGADDYITKPFSPREVVARVRAMLRRGRASADPDAPLRFDGLEIDCAGRAVTGPDGQVNLSNLEFELLLALAQAPGRVFSRRQLLQRVWGYDFFGDERVVDVHIRNLRAKLDDNAGEPRLIATVRGAGYKFVGRPS